MLQFLVAEAQPGAVVQVDGADYHYLARVRRLAAGATLTVVDGAGTRYPATVTEVAASSLRLSIGSAPAAAGAPQAAAPPGPRAALTLIQALPKGALMDRIVRQATELGVTTIVPVVAARTQGRLDAAAAARKRARWERIARQAMQQSGAPPPVIDAPLPLPRYLAQRPAAALELLFEPGAASLRQVLDRRPPPGTPVRCAVGPEGGFSPAERELFSGYGFRTVGLPAAVLRVDTAAVAALTAVGQLLEAAP